MLCSECSLLVHVSATNELDSEVEAEHLGGSNLIANGLGHSFEIALVAVQNDVLVSDIEQVGELLAK